MANYDPCAGHECDHCWICTNLGVCCGQVPNIKAFLTQDHFTPAKDRTDEFLEAIQTDSPHLSMATLVKLDIEVSLTVGSAEPLQLEAGPPSDMLSNLQADSEEETILVRRLNSAE